MIPIVQVQTAQQALEVLSLGKEVLVTPFPTDELMRRLRVTRAGAFDFCGTLVTGSQWRALESLLPMEDQLRGKANIDWVQAHRGGSDSSDVEDFQDWFLGHIHPDNKDAIDSALALIPIMLAEKAGVLMEDVCRVGGELPMRDGADLLMQCFAPSWRVIISFGIEQEIQQWLRVHELFAYVAATRLGEDPQGRVKGCLLTWSSPQPSAWPPSALGSCTTFTPTRSSRSVTRSLTWT